jgi:cell division protein ZapE
MSGPLATFRRRVEAGELEADPAQEAAVAALQRLYDDLLAAGPPTRGWRRALARLAGRRTAPVQGLYLWGSVGRGKTFLMDLFYACLPFEDKRRQHFHRFMAWVHAELKQFRHKADPLELVADSLAARTRIICFDEFAVTDIADAMILGKLFTALFARGVTLAATSNIAPHNLYRDGLQRARFLPAIAQIETHTMVMNMGGDHDYRLRALERADVYQQPAGPQADTKLHEFFTSIAPEEGEGPGTIDVLGRQIGCRKSADGVIWFDFSEICDGPRSQDDYIEVARCYQTVLVSDVPRFDPTLENQARRFIALVDEFYDRRVKLILSAEAKLGDLYDGKKLRHAFARTRSRLEEMQSHDYLATAHRS